MKNSRLGNETASSVRSSKVVEFVPSTKVTGSKETAHLLRSPKNAQRLLTALRRAEKGQGKPVSVGHLRQEMGLEPSP